MATIKTQTYSGQRRIITKLSGSERKASCSCCEEVSCCLLDTQLNLDTYPTGAIIQDKLPPIIIFEGNALSAGVLGYGEITNGVFLENGIWAVYKNGTRSTRRCLISNIANDIVDDFPPSVEVTYSNLGLTVNAILSRISLCVYQGSYSYLGGDRSLSISYNTTLFNGNAWTLIAPIIGVDQDEQPILVGDTISNNQNANEPFGTFTGFFAEDITQTPIEINVTVDAVE